MSLLFLQGAQGYLQATAHERKRYYTNVTLSLPATQVVWQKKGKELNINGKLFDVDHFRWSNGALQVTGFYDHEEMSLVGFLSKLATTANGNSFLRLLLVLQCFALPFELVLLERMRRKKPLHSTFFSFFLPSPFRPVAGQPPQC